MLRWQKSGFTRGSQSTAGGGHREQRSIETVLSDGCIDLVVSSRAGIVGVRARMRRGGAIAGSSAGALEPASP
jgi:hypothetical protein